jgi:hypothetical protein
MKPCYRTPHQAEAMFRARVKQLGTLINELQQFGEEAKIKTSSNTWKALRCHHSTLEYKAGLK